MKIGIIGEGAIGRYVAEALQQRGWGPHAVLARTTQAKDTSLADVVRVTSVTELPAEIALVLDCGGHAALTQHGPALLAQGTDVITLSLGALADATLAETLTQAAQSGGAQLHLASGAIGALDSLRAAKVGGLTDVTYIGRKPPLGWKGSPAEVQLDLGSLSAPTVHFEGTARQAALSYPKNANVAAAVALAGTGFDDTRVKLVADPTITANIHEVQATGAFGQFSFRIEGSALPDNPRSSALAAMSMVASVERLLSPMSM